MTKLSVHDDTFTNLVARARKDRDGESVAIFSDWLRERGVPECAIERFTSALRWPEGIEGIRSARYYDTVEFPVGAVPWGFKLELFRDLENKSEAESNLRGPRRVYSGIYSGAEFFLERIRVDVRGPVEPLRGVTMCTFKINARLVTEVPLRVLLDAGLAGVPVETDVLLEPAKQNFRGREVSPAVWGRGPWRVTDTDDLVGRISVPRPSTASPVEYPRSSWDGGSTLVDRVRITVYLEGWERRPIGT